MHTHSSSCTHPSDSDGLARGAPVDYLGPCVSIPVGRCTLGRVINVTGDASDGYAGLTFDVLDAFDVLDGFDVGDVFGVLDVHDVCCNTF